MKTIKTFSVRHKEQFNLTLESKALNGRTDVHTCPKVMRYLFKDTHVLMS